MVFSRSESDTLDALVCGRDVDASCFGPADAPPPFVALEHADPAYAYYLAELLLCFAFEHEGKRHECFFVEYLWPSDLQHDGTEKSRDKDGVSLWTRYGFPPVSTYEVRPVEQVHFRPALFEPPSFVAPTTASAQRYRWVLCDDIYGNF